MFLLGIEKVSLINVKKSKLISKSQDLLSYIFLQNFLFKPGKRCYCYSAFRFFYPCAHFKRISNVKNTRGRVKNTRLEVKATKKSEAKAKDSPSEDRPSRDQGQECSRLRTNDTGASVLQKKNVFNKIF